MAYTINWTGAGGPSYTTELCQFGKTFRTNPGVYIFCKPSATLKDRWDQIYVGETDDFNDRLNTNLASHHRWDCIKRNGATNVCVLLVTGGKQARTTIETDLRNGLDPVCNRQ